MSSPVRRPQFLADADHGDSAPTPASFKRHALPRTQVSVVRPPASQEPSAPAFVTPQHPHGLPTPPPPASVPPVPSPAARAAQMAQGFPPMPVPSAPTPIPGMGLGPDPRLEAAIETLKRAGQRLAEEARSDALEIGFLVARRILEQELTTSPQPLFALIRTAIRRAGEAKQVRVKLSPQDKAKVEAASAEDKGRLSLLTLELVADPDLGPGDVVVDTELGSVDGRLSTRLAELARAVEHAESEGVG